MSAGQNRKGSGEKRQTKRHEKRTGDVCMDTGKRSFESRKLARSVLKRLAHQRDEAGVYRCPKCGGWHLTHYTSPTGRKTR